MPEQEATKIENKKFDENATNTIGSIDKLLSMAEESEEKVAEYEQYAIFISVTVVFATFALFLMLFTTPWYKLLGFEVFSLVILIILLVATISFFTVKFLEVSKNIKKEVITFNESLGVVQELLPYYFDKMSVLDKTIYKIRLSKLDIVATGVKQDNNN